MILAPGSGFERDVLRSWRGFGGTGSVVMLALPRGKRATDRGGQRLTTALLYLTSPAAGGGSGGDTVFTELGLRCRPQAGRLLVFRNCRPGEAVPDPRLRHAGEPVIVQPGSPANAAAAAANGHERNKWICNKWVRERPLRARRGSMMEHLYGVPACASAAAGGTALAAAGGPKASSIADQHLAANAAAATNIAAAATNNATAATHNRAKRSHARSQVPGDGGGGGGDRARLLAAAQEWKTKRRKADSEG